jgi:hypothetical protein
MIIILISFNYLEIKNCIEASLRRCWEILFFAQGREGVDVRREWDGFGRQSFPPVLFLCTSRG